MLDKLCKNSLKTPQDITLGDSGGLIACDHASSSVIYINKDGNKFGVVLKEDENVKNPLSVSYDMYTKRLVVTCRNSNKIRDQYKFSSGMLFATFATLYGLVISNIFLLPNMMKQWSWVTRFHNVTYDPRASR